MLEKSDNFNRTFISTYPSLLFEQFYKENYQHVLILNAEKESFKNLQKSSSSLNDYSFGLFLRGNKDTSLKRTDFTYANALSDGQSVIFGAKKHSSFSYITLSSDSSKSVFNTHVENATYVDIFADSSSGCFKVENNKNGVKKFTFCADQFVIEDYLTVSKDLLVKGNTQLQGNLNVSGITSLTITNVNGVLTVNGPVIASAFIISEGGGGGGGGGGESNSESGNSGGGTNYTTNLETDYTTNLKKYVATIGDTTNTVYTITHNLNTRDIHVSVYNNSGNYDDVEVEIRRPTTNSIEIRTSSPPGNNALRVVIIG